MPSFLCNYVTEKQKKPCLFSIYSDWQNQILDKIKIFQYQTFVLYEMEYEKLIDIPGKYMLFLTKNELGSLSFITGEAGY